MQYLYETHLHTAEASACARSPGADYIKAYKEIGYAGIIVTDHFYNSNTAINRNLPWREWVECFCKGYENAKNEGEKQGLSVFFGWEETFTDDDYLVYGLDKEWLLEHPEVRHWTRKEQYETVKKNGGLVVQAHPFRQHAYIREIYLETEYVDAVEIANAGNDPSFDALAKRYADILGVPEVAGSDMHSVECVDKAFGVYLHKKMDSIQNYIEAVCGNRLELKTPHGRCDWRGNEKIIRPAEISGRSVPNIWDFLKYPENRKKHMEQ